MHKGPKSLLEITTWQIQSYLSHRISHICSVKLSNFICFQYNIYYTGRFIMLSVITNICNKKPKGHTLTELFTVTRILDKHFFWQIEMFDVCTAGDTAHIDMIFRFLPHTSTWVHRHSSLLQWSVTLGQRGHVAMLGRILCTKCTLHSNHRLPRVILQHTKRLLPRSGHFLIIYSHRLAAEMWTTMKNNLLGEKKLSFSFYLNRFRK